MAAYGAAGGADFPWMRETAQALADALPDGRIRTLEGQGEMSTRRSWLRRCALGLDLSTSGSRYWREHEAEEQLKRLRPDEGQEVQVMHVQDSVGRSRFHVTVH